MRSTWLPTNIVLGVLVRTTPDIPNFGQEIKKEILSFFLRFPATKRSPKKRNRWIRSCHRGKHGGGGQRSSVLDGLPLIS